MRTKHSTLLVLLPVAAGWVGYYLGAMRETNVTHMPRGATVALDHLVSAESFSEVELRRGELLVNRRPLTEDYAIEPGWLSLRRGRLFDNRYALLGDNRSGPLMLSVHAVVSKDQILGKVSHSVRLWPSGRSS